jgi:VWFA-related protein
VIALPKKKDAPADAAPRAAPRPRSRIRRGCPTSLRIEVPEVSVDVGVLLEKTHQFVPGLKPSNFRVYEDGVEQKVVGFKRVEAPITALMICEFAPRNLNSYSGFIYDMRNAAFAFAQQLRPQDYVALMTFDMRNQIQLDFTQDKRQLLQAINSCAFPASARRNV